MIHIVINPTGASGKTRRLWDKVETVFRESGQPYTVHFSDLERGVEDICREVTAADKETDLVVVGGDGTFNEALNGICRLADVRLGLIPAGSGNDLARDLGIPTDGITAARTILRGEVVRTTDVGEVAIRLPAGEGERKRRFLTGCGIGFDAEICDVVDHSRLKGALNRLRMGKLVYVLTAIRLIWQCRLQTVEVQVEKEGERATLASDHNLLLVFMNHRYEGGGFQFAPEARDDDGALDLCIANPRSKWEFFPVFPLAYSGRHVKVGCVRVERAPSFAVRATQPLWVHTDGEAVCRSQDIRVGVLPERLRLLV